jgi:hypothetical protein
MFLRVSHEGLWQLGILVAAVALGGSVCLPAGATDFVDVTTDAGLSGNNSLGAAWGDFDLDGCVDLYISNDNASTPSSQLFRSLCDGTFEDVTSTAGVAGPLRAWGVAWADFDNDGDLDLYIASRSDSNMLYRNDGDGTFTSIGVSAGVADSRGSTGVAWGDYDNDGDLDLFVANRYTNSSGTNRTDRLYRNNGDSTFTDVAGSAGVGGQTARGSFSGVWADFNDDGHLDLYVAADFSDDFYYENDGLGGFDNLSGTAGVDDPQHGMGTAVGDANGDGCLDVISTNNTQVLDPPDPTHLKTFIYLNNCNAVFTPDDAGILARDAVEWGVNFVDYDNDMDEDISIVAGGLLSFGEPNVLYENDGDGDYSDVTADSGVANSGASFGSAWADYDRDGDLDWFIANEIGSRVLFRNDGPTGNYFAVELEGVASNRFGVGARVEIVAGGVTQVRVIQAGESFLSAEEAVAFFGLGSETSVTSVAVEWPSGTTDNATNVNGNQRVLFKEGLGIQGQDCHLLTLGHTGSGSDPVAEPTNSIGCALGEYLNAEPITLSGAVPASGWSIDGWTGTSDDSSTGSTNSLTMGNEAQQVLVRYVDPTLPVDLVISETTLASEEIIEACGSITVGPNVDVTATNSGVVLRAPSLVVAELATTSGAVLSFESVLPVGCPAPGSPGQVNGRVKGMARFVRR